VLIINFKLQRQRGKSPQVWPLSAPASEREGVNPVRKSWDMSRWIRTREPPGGRSKDLEKSPKNHFLEKWRKATLGNWNAASAEGSGTAWERLQSDVQVASEPTLQLQAQILSKLGARATFLQN
jgi:hypothetical protein